MGKDLLTKEEFNSLLKIMDRIETAMKAKGISSYADLNACIENKRNASPQLNMYTKMQKKIKESSFYDMSLDSLIAIADALDVSTDYILGIPNKKARENEPSIKGLTPKALSNLNIIIEKADGSENYASKYHKNRAEKKMAALNWILEHMQDDNYDSYDFLEAIYFLVMTRFKNHRGGDTETVLNSIETHKEFIEYKDALHRLKNPVFFADAEGHLITREDLDKKTVHSARRAFVESEMWNRQRRKTIEMFLNENIVNIVDPVTYDDIWVSLGNPHDIIKDCLLDLIKEWREEYDPIYEKLAKRQKTEEDAWLKEVENEPYPGDPEYIYPEVEEDETVPEELRYREPYLRGLNESQMRMYLMLLFLERNGIELMHMADDGELILRYKGEDLDNKILGSTVGIYKKANTDRYYYDEKLSEPSYDQLKNIYINNVLPHYLEDALSSHNEFWGVGYVTDSYIWNYTAEERNDIEKRFKEAGGRYEIVNDYVHVFWDK